MATDDAGRRAKELVVMLSDGVDPFGPTFAGAIAAAIRAAVDDDRRRVCAVLSDALPGAGDLLRRIREGTQ